MACCVWGAPCLLLPGLASRPWTLPATLSNPCSICRDDLLPQGLDVNPALESYPDFVRDLPSPVRRRKGAAGLRVVGVPRP